MASKTLSSDSQERPKLDRPLEDAVTPGPVLTGPGSGITRTLYDFTKVSERTRDHFFYDPARHPSWRRIILAAMRRSRNDRRRKVNVTYGDEERKFDGIWYTEATNVSEVS